MNGPARLLLDLTPPGLDALSPEAVIIINTGPLNGTGAPSSSRFNLSFKNVMTGGIASSNCGGQFGVMLKRAGFDGLIIESHCNPECAWSDAAQQVTPDILDYILNLLVIRSEHQTTENLNELRRQIDECDNDLMDILAKRMRVCREIGTFKKEHNMTILQTGRYNEILDKRGAQGSLCGMDSDFVKQVFELIHEESVRQQMEIINK